MNAMSTPIGRTIRVLMGVTIIAVGLRRGGAAGWAMAVFGLAPLATGAGNVCPINPLLGAPLRGGRCGTGPAKQEQAADQVTVRQHV